MCRGDVQVLLKLSDGRERICAVRLSYVMSQGKVAT